MTTVVSIGARNSGALQKSLCTSLSLARERFPMRCTP
jgi:hypothetical protein